MDYLNAMSSGVHQRKPEPGFHPLVFAERNPPEAQVAADPYVRFLKAGRPPGPWLLRVIEPQPSGTPHAPPSQLKAALHIHAFFIGHLPEILRRLHANRTLPDLFVTVATVAARDMAQEVLKDYRGRVAAIETVQNLGRDIGPFLTHFGPRLVDGYDVVGHVHGKQSKEVDNPGLIAAWIAFLYENALGGERGGGMIDRILSEFAADETLGIVYPDDPNILGWTGNRPHAEELVRRMGLGDLPQAFNFPVGTTFWIRSAALRPFTDLRLGWADYPSEPLSYDGSRLHALERLFGVVPVMTGWTAAVTNIRGMTR